MPSVPRLASLGSAAVLCAIVGLYACKGSSDDGGASPDAASGAPTATPGPGDAAATPPAKPSFDNGGRACTGTTRASAKDQTDVLAVPAGVVVPAGFTIEAIAYVAGARHVAALPNGDLLVGTSGESVLLVPHADSPKAGEPTVFVRSPEAPVHGVTFHEPSCNVFVGTRTGIYRYPYEDGQAEAAPAPAIARVRQQSSDGHVTTSVAVAGAYLYAGVGSSCNACEEVDPTRATVQRMNLDGSGMETYARRIRNPIALVENPHTGVLWAGNAGQDSLPEGHPYELFDAVTAHPLGADYGWPHCEENQRAYTGGVDCSGTVVPRVVLPAYSTLTGAVFYPTTQSGAHAFPASFRGGAFVVAHGAWHQSGGGYFSPPRVVYVPMIGDTPAKAVDWTDPSTQWTDFVSGFESPDRQERVGRPVGAAVGPDGSLFVTDDLSGLVYRIRPAT